jgi:microcin C transport system ATP-binding protein
MLLQIIDLNTLFPIDIQKGQTTTKQILHNISLSIEHSQTVALVGESGSGKSVTALSILRLLEESSNAENSGSIVFEGNNLFDFSMEEMRKIRGNQIAMIFQEPMTSLNPVYTIGNQLMEPLIWHQHLPSEKAKTEAIRLLDRTGIKDPSARLKAYPHQLSGGQRQRVMIAMALACRPALLIADEPTTALDVTIQAQILDLIQDLQSEYQMAVLLITHDLTMVKKVANHIYIMKNGHILENGDTHTLFKAPKHSYTQKLLQSFPHDFPQKRDHKSIALKVDNLQCQFPLKRTFTDMITGNKPKIKAVDNISLSIHAGSTCGIVGESGSGKTTLGMAVLRLIQSKGKILFNDKEIHLLNARELRPLRKELQVVFQDPFSSLSPRLTIEQIISEGLKVHFPEFKKEQRRSLIGATLEEVGLERNMAFRYPHEFSGGQRQRIAIARAIILKPKLLILDEPTSALDMTIQAQVLELLKELQRKYGITYLFISHDLRVVRSLADQVIVMQNGKIVEAGPSEQRFTSPQQEYTKKLFNATLH